MKSEKKSEKTLSHKRLGLSKAARDLLSRVRASPSAEAVWAGGGCGRGQGTQGHRPVEAAGGAAGFAVAGRARAGGNRLDARRPGRWSSE